MRIRYYVLILFFICCLSITGCSNNTSNLLTSQNNGISATLTLEPNTPIAMENTTFKINLMEGNQPVYGAETFLDLTMPGMKMPQNRIKAIETEPGSYSTTTLLSMAGDWHLQVDVTHKSGTYTFDFDFKAK